MNFLGKILRKSGPSIVDIYTRCESTFERSISVGEGQKHCYTYSASLCCIWYRHLKLETDASADG